MTLHYIKQWLLPLFLGLWLLLSASAQEISNLSPSALPFGTYITGLYHLEADDGSGLYVEEQAGGALTAAAALDTGASGFYFWLVENVYKDYFQLYSATQQGKLMQINTDGSIQWTTDATAETSKLLFRMYPEDPGAERTDAHQGVVAIGYITTGALSANPGNADCQCNFLTVADNARFRVHNSGIDNISNYRPVVFEKTNDANTLGTVIIDNQNNRTRIVQSPPPIELELPHNFVSSNFFAGGFGENDFKIVVHPGTEGYVGFLEYTDHHYTKAVYRSARTKIGLKIAKDTISLEYLSGDELLPNGSLINRKVVITNTISTNDTISLGFKDQDSLIVNHSNGSRYGLRAAPAELFFNRSVTQTARMLVSLVKGTVDIAYTTKNRLINSETDNSTDSGSDLVSTDAYLPYNRGNTFVNTFDWTQTKWPVRYGSEISPTTGLVYSPFYSDEDAFSGIAAKYNGSGDYQGREDYLSTEGWELIKANLGYNADRTEANFVPQYPYALFYNRVSGTLRVVVYVENQSISNQLRVTLSAINAWPDTEDTDATNTYVPKLWGSLQQFASLDQVANTNYERVVPFYSNTSPIWYFTDFVMEYDPCIAFFESTIKLEVTKITEGDLTMIGRMEGGGIPAGTTAYNDWQNQQDNFLMGVLDNGVENLANTLGDITFNQYEKFNLTNFKNTVNGTLQGKEIASWKKEKARIEWEATQTIADATIAEGRLKIGEGTAQIVEGFATMADPNVPILSMAPSTIIGGAKIAQGATKIAQGSTKITAGNAKARLASAKRLYYDNIKDKVKHSDQTITMNVPPPRPQVVFGELALQGKLTLTTTLTTAKPFIATPGGLNSDNAPEWYGNGSRGSEPLYNRPLGKFTLLKQPQFAIGIAKDISSADIGYKA